MTEPDTLAVRVRKDLPGYTSMIPRAAKQRYCFVNRVYKSTCTILLAFMLTKKAVLDTGCGALALGTHATCSCSCVFTAKSLLFVLYMFLVKVRLSTDASCTISIHTGGELYGIIFFLAREIFFWTLWMKWVPRTTDTAKFLTISSTTHTQASPIRTWSIMVRTTLNFWLVALRNQDLFETFTELIRWVRQWSHVAGLIQCQCQKITFTGCMRH